MSFEETKQKAEKWTKGSQINLVDSVKNDRKFVFSSLDGTNVSFWITMPEGGDNSSWNVWSDSDVVLTHLNDVIDFASSCRSKNIADILDKAYKALKPLFGATADSDSDCLDSDDDGFDDNYYEEEDLDAIQDAQTKQLESDDDVSAEQFFTGDGSSTAVHRLIKDLKNVKAANGKFGVTGEPRGDNLFIWDVKLTDFPKDTLLGKDIQDYAKKYNREPVVSMEMKFPKEYPMAPPFVRVLRPRFKFLTGHVTQGGSVCMEMLTRSGWRPTNDIESILVQIRAEIISDKNARLDHSNMDTPYSEDAAKQAFERMVQRYGWNK